MKFNKISHFFAAFFLLALVLFTSCGKPLTLPDNTPQVLYQFDTPGISESVRGSYTLELHLEYDEKNIKISGEPADIFNNSRGSVLIIDLNQANQKSLDKIKLLVEALAEGEEDYYDIDLTSIICKYNGRVLTDGCIIELDSRVLTGSDKWKTRWSPIPSGVKYDIPTPLWLKLTIWISVLLILGFIIYKVAKRIAYKNRTFQGGRLAFNKPALNQIKLEGKEEFELGKYLIDNDSRIGGSITEDNYQLKLIHKKLKHKGKTKKFVRMMFDSPLINIKIKHFDGDEIATNFHQLFHLDEIIIKFKIPNSDAVEYNITYFNNETKRS